MRSDRQLSILIHHLCINDLPTKYPRENFKLTKYTRAKILERRNTTEKKNLTHEYPRKNFSPKEGPREKTLDTRNTYQKKFYTHETPWEKNSVVTQDHVNLRSQYTFFAWNQEKLLFINIILSRKSIYVFTFQISFPPPPWKNVHRKNLSFEGFFLKVHQFSLVSL